MRRLAVAILGLHLFAALLPAFAAEQDLRLIDAIRRHDSSAVRALILSRTGVASINATQGDGSTALHWAVHYDDVATVDLLLRAGARINAANDLGVTPLYLACTNRNAVLVEKLLAVNADPNSTLPNGETVLMNCARTGNAATVKALVIAGARVNVKEPGHDQTALMWAAAEKHSDAVRVLIEAGADIRARSRAYAQTVTSEVTQRAGREELNYTVERGGSTPLLFGARSGDIESIRLLLAAGADVNDALPNGMSALVLAAHSGHGPAASLLLAKGADPNAAAIGYTALHAAVLRGDLNLVNDLLNHGANPNARIVTGTPLRRNSQDFNLPATLIGATPYWLAAKFLEAGIMRALVDHGANPASTLPDGTTPLMAAAGAREPAAKDADRRGLSLLDGGKLPDESVVAGTVTVALLHPQDIDAVTRTGETALHVAATLGYDRVVQLIAEKGASLNLKNNRGLTALDILSGRMRANRQNSPALLDAIDLLRKLGATSPLPLP